MLVFSMKLGLHWALFGIGSYAIRSRICSPNTLFSFCIVLKKAPWRINNESLVESLLTKYVCFMRKNGFQRLLQKKVALQTQMGNYSQARRLLERQPHVRAVQTRNRCLGSSWSTVWVFCRKKCTGLKIGVKNWLDCWIVVNQLNGLLTFQS